MEGEGTRPIRFGAAMLGRAAALAICCALWGCAQPARAPAEAPPAGLSVQPWPRPAKAPAVSPSKDDSLFVAFGGKPELDQIADNLVARVKADPRIGKFFERTNSKGLSDSLSEQFCFLLGGPCAYSGASMAKAHADLGVGRADFNALVEDLQAAMDDSKIPFSLQNKLLALLAPMHRDIVTRH